MAHFNEKYVKLIGELTATPSSIKKNGKNTEVVLLITDIFSRLLAYSDIIFEKAELEKWEDNVLKMKLQQQNRFINLMQNVVRSYFRIDALTNEEKQIILKTLLYLKSQFVSLINEEMNGDLIWKNVLFGATYLTAYNFYYYIFKLYVYEAYDTLKFDDLNNIKEHTTNLEEDRRCVLIEFKPSFEMMDLEGFFFFECGLYETAVEQFDAFIEFLERSKSILGL